MNIIVGINLLLNPEKLAEIMDDFGMAAILISLALNIVVSVLGVIPTFFYFRCKCPCFWLASRICGFSDWRDNWCLYII